MLVVGMGVGWALWVGSVAKRSAFFMARGCEFTPCAALFSHAKHAHANQKGLSWRVLKLSYADFLGCPPSILFSDLLGRVYSARLGPSEPSEQIAKPKSERTERTSERSINNRLFRASSALVT